MQIISILNTKGGVGKTTIATNLAVMFAREQKKVLLVDSDHQSSSSDFRTTRISNPTVAQFTATQIQSPTLHIDIPNFQFDYIIIDVGAKDNKVFRSAIMASDFAIVPLCPSQYDFWGSQNTFDILQEASISLPSLKTFAVLNMVIPRTKIAKEVQKLISEFEATYKVKFMKSNLTSRVAYKYSVSEGLGVIELSSKDAKAKKEINNFFNEIKECIKIK